jgi:hypothetical protein
MHNKDHRPSLNNASTQLTQRAELIQSLDRAYTEGIHNTEHRQSLNNAITELIPR